MSLHPVVRYMILCEDWGHDPDNSKRIHIHGLLSNIKSIDDPPYPLLYEELCVFLALTETRGSGKAKIICILDETGQEIFSTKEHTCNFGEDPLEVVGVPFRIKDCTFPQAGLYSIQFWYENELIAGRPLRLR